MFSHFIFNIKKKLSHIWNLYKICVLNTIFYIAMTLIKKVKNHFFPKKNYFLWNQLDSTVFRFFTRTTQNKKQNQLMASSRAKTWSTWSQKCVKYRGNNMFMKRNSDVNTGDLKNVQIRLILTYYLQFLENYMCFIFNFMHDLRAVTKTVHLAPRYQGHSLSVQCYAFYLHAILFLQLIQTLPHMATITTALVYQVHI